MVPWVLLLRQQLDREEETPGPIQPSGLCSPLVEGLVELQV